MGLLGDFQNLLSELFIYCCFCSPPSPNSPPPPPDSQELVQMSSTPQEDRHKPPAHAQSTASSAGPVAVSAAAKRGGDRTVLSYHNSLLKESDVSLLAAPNWLNDKVLGFHFEYLEYDYYYDFSSEVTFVNPEVAQFVKLYNGSELGMLLDPLNLHEKKLILLPVNDNASASVGGSHWSLLVYSRKDGAFSHYDSLIPHNSQPAKRCSEKLIPFLKASVKPIYREVKDCPQQRNGYDCGVYAMCFAEAVCAVKLGKEEERATIDTMSPKKAQEWRAITQARIQSMAQEWRRAQN